MATGSKLSLENTQSLHFKDIQTDGDQPRRWPSCDLYMPAGSILQVVGRNGSGKSTFLRVLAGLLPSQGWMSQDGSRFCPQELHWRKQIFYLSPYCLDIHDPEQYLAQQYYLDGGSKATAKHLHELVKQLGFAKKTQHYAGYSSGEQRRLQLSPMLYTKRSLWLLDEVFCHLDETWQAWVQQRISAHIERGGRVVLTTHGHYQADQYYHLDHCAAS